MCIRDSKNKVLRKYEATTSVLKGETERDFINIAGEGQFYGIDLGRYAGCRIIIDGIEVYNLPGEKASGYVYPHPGYTHMWTCLLYTSRQLRVFSIKIQQKKDELEGLKAAAENVSAGIDSERVQTSPKDRMPDDVSRIVDLESEIHKDIQELLILKNLSLIHI